MPYNVEIINETDCLRVEVKGSWEPGEELENAILVWSRVADACRTYSQKRILSIWDIPGHLPTMKAYSLAKSPDSFKWELGFKLAVVHLQIERFYDALFAETVAVNRGYQVKIFRDEQSAKKWLLES